MSNITVIDNNHLKMWEQQDFLEAVQEVYGKDLSKIEFKLFLEMGKALDLNPFIREIWAVKYGNNAAQIFIGRDGYRKVAQRHPDYEYHYSEAVYSNDTFEAREGIYDHQFNLKDRGVLRGAFCKVKKRSSERPFCLYVPFEEYNKSQSNWKTMPSTMIKKVAEAQCLRMAFQDTFSGTFEEAENWIDVSPSKEKEEPKNEHKKQQYIPAQKEKVDSEPVFNAVNDFNSKKANFENIISELCKENIGIYSVDSELADSFKLEFLQYFKDEYIKHNGKVLIDELFSKKLLAKRLNILALRHNLVREERLNDKELHDLKKIVYDIAVLDKGNNLEAIFIQEASSYVKF